MAEINIFEQAPDDLINTHLIALCAAHDEAAYEVYIMQVFVGAESQSTRTNVEAVYMTATMQVHIAWPRSGVLDSAEVSVINGVTRIALEKTIGRWVDDAAWKRFPVERREA